MSNFTMTDKKWDANKSKIGEWLKVNVLPKDRIAFINYAFAEGDANPDMRKNWWGTVCSAFRDVVNSPIVKGQRSTLPDSIQALLLAEQTAYAAEVEAIHENYPRFCAYNGKHGKSGYGAYSSGEERAEALCEKMVRLITNAFNAHEKDDTTKPYFFDGSIGDDGIPILTHNIQPDDAETATTDSTEPSDDSTQEDD